MRYVLECPKCGSVNIRPTAIDGFLGYGNACCDCQWVWHSLQQVQDIFGPDPAAIEFSDAEWSEFLGDLKNYKLP